MTCPVIPFSMNSTAKKSREEDYLNLIYFTIYVFHLIFNSQVREVNNKKNFSEVDGMKVNQVTCID